MTRPLLGVENSFQSAISCLLYNISSFLGSEYYDVEAIDQILCSAEWTEAMISEMELGHPAGSPYSPVSILGEEIRFLLRCGLNAHYIDPFNPAKFAQGGARYLAEYRRIFSGINLSEKMIADEFSSNGLEIWHARVARQLGDYAMRPYFHYSERRIEFDEVVEFARTGALIRLPWHRTPWFTLPALVVGYAGDQLLVHYPAVAGDSAVMFSRHDMSLETWRPEHGAIIYSRR